MATKSASLRLILEYKDDTTESPSKDFDETLTLLDFDDATPGRRKKLTTTASDEALTFTDAIGLIVFSHNYPFSYRLKSAETLIGPTMLAVVGFAPDTTDGFHTTSILLTGNGDNVADLEIWIIEKP